MWNYLAEHGLEIAGVILGIIYLLQELKASRAMWITGMIMPLISLFVYFRAGLYADFAIDIYYFLIGIYGFIAWKRGTGKKKTDLPITHTPVKHIVPLVIVFAILFVAIGLVLQNWTNSTVPWQDSFTTALSIIGLWMLARKWIEQWWVWFVVDAVSTGLYIYKGIPFYAALYGLYTILAVYGYFKWKKKMQQTPEPALDI